MARLDIERQNTLEPKRMEFAKNKLSELKLKIVFESETELIFLFNENKITLFPYSGWHSGKGIKSGRGLTKLLKQLK